MLHSGIAAPCTQLQLPVVHFIKAIANYHCINFALECEANNVYSFIVRTQLYLFTLDRLVAIEAVNSNEKTAGLISIIIFAMHTNYGKTFSNALHVFTQYKKTTGLLSCSIFESKWGSQSQHCCFHGL